MGESKGGSRQLNYGTVADLDRTVGCEAVKLFPFKVDYHQVPVQVQSRYTSIYILVALCICTVFATISLFHSTCSSESLIASIEFLSPPLPDRRHSEALVPIFGIFLKIFSPIYFNLDENFVKTRGLGPLFFFSFLVGFGFPRALVT